MIELGSAFAPTIEDPIDLLVADIERRVLEGVAAALKELRPPDVVVHSPNVKVNAAVDVPESSIDVKVELPGIDRLVKVLDDIKGLLVTPVTRTVERSSDGMIETITDRRG